MDKQQAQDIVKDTLQNPFDRERFVYFVKNLLNSIEESKSFPKPLTGSYIKESFRDRIKSYDRIGRFIDVNGKVIDILTVCLHREKSLAQARTSQRNFVSGYLRGDYGSSSSKDAAIVAFYCEDTTDWRFSLVTIDHVIDVEKLKVKQEFSSAKRFSFLVGENESSHTAQTQLLPLLDDKKIPTLDEIEKSFSIEKVTKEFYTEIAKKFTELVGGERKIGLKKMVEKGCLRLPSTDDDTIEKEFAVRLIGRLLFCWFLKKKKSEKDVPLLDNIIISSRAVQQVTGYYHNMLERLFFQVLNTPHNKRIKEASHDPWPKVPFLNGGLFEPHRHDYYEIDALNHSKHLNTLIVPDEWLKELFKLFELYNFTIDESTTIDVDISVDPEMLGRIFENLLAEINPQTGETARKSTGSYYTPRPIVEYMVDESLKQYLLTQLSVSKDVIPVKTGIQKEKGLDSCLRRNDDNGIETKISQLLSYADSDIDLSEEEKDFIIDALDRVKIIDPACGSGAFPMGILHKMLLVLQKIDPESKKWLTRKLARIDNKLLRKELESKLKSENWDYVHKLGIIQNSIYGVDIQSIAVEISKLRFFLSLIVDEKIDDKKPNRGVVPLPNLEFKFVAANSLIGLPKAESGFAESHADIERLKELREAYFTSYGDEKREIERKFGETQHKMFLHALNWQATGSQTYKLSEWNPFADEAASWFDPEWMFGIKSPSPLAGEGKGEGGFDVVIANPPYVNVSNLETKDREMYKKIFTVTKNKVDLYAFFIERGNQILRNEGVLTYIVPHTWKATTSFSKLRELIFNNFELKIIVELDYGAFEATVKPVVIILQKHRAQNYRISVLNSDFETMNNIDIKEIFQSKDSALDTLSTSTEKMLFKKVEKDTIPLDNVCKFTRGIKTSNDERFVKREALDSEYKKVVRGRNVDKYFYQWDGEYVWYRPDLMKEKVGSLPHSKELFEVPEKLVLQRISKGLVGSYDDQEMYALDTCLISDIKTLNKKYSIKFTLALINSRLLNFWYYKKFALPTVSGYELHQLPIKQIPLEKQRPFISLVDKILSITKDEDYLESKAKQAKVREYEKQIDQLVYELYGLTDEEIVIIEGDKK